MQVLALTDYYFNSGRPDTAVHFMEMLTNMKLEEPEFTSAESDAPPRQLSEGYVLRGCYHLSDLPYYDEVIPPGDQTVQWEFRSSWLWRSEQCHDAHLAETMRGTLTVGGASICEFFSYNKPYHGQYGGGIVDQRWLILHKEALLNLHARIARRDDLFAFLLMLSCGAQHVSATKGTRYSLYNLIVQAGAEHIQVPYRQITIVMSDERGNAQTTRTLGADPHTGNAIADVGEWGQFSGWQGCKPPPPSIK